MKLNDEDGQALLVSEMMDVLADPKRGRDGLFPELVLFDCHACHKPMGGKKWGPRQGTGLGPGVVRLNDWRPEPDESPEPGGNGLWAGVARLT